MIDLHLHTKNFSHDSENDPERVVKIMEKKGFKTIAFTDHIEFNPKDPAYGDFDYEKAKELVEDLRKKTGMKLLLGGEIGYEPQLEETIRNYLKDKDFDFTIGSIHAVGDYFISEWVRKQEREGGSFREYFEILLKLVKSGLFDVVGHFDYYKKHMEKDPVEVFEENRDIVVEVLEEVIKQGMVLEVNTSGLRQPPGEPYPSGEILELYKELGGRYVTLGSDAHRECHLGYGIEEGLRLINSLGLSLWIP
ncbi:hypothetical protein DRQ18_05035 [bacterium]|nr:MAG: hypothetical protein DRQ18_05035 [bacterium]